MTNSSVSERELVFRRTLNAPRELVFEAWTNPEHLQRWWGPNGFSATNAFNTQTPTGMNGFNSSSNSSTQPFGNSSGFGGGQLQPQPTGFGGSTIKPFQPSSDFGKSIKDQGQPNLLQF